MDISVLSETIDLSDGEWIDDIPSLEGIRLKVRSTNFKPYQVALQAIARRFGKRLQTDEGRIDFNVKSGAPLAEHILLDWDLSAAEGITALKRDGQLVRYSREDSMIVLTASDNLGIGAAFRQGVEYAGDRAAERIAQRAQEVAGN